MLCLPWFTIDPLICVSQTCNLQRAMFMRNSALAIAHYCDLWTLQIVGKTSTGGR
jgi:hypothetical protein